MKTKVIAFLLVTTVWMGGCNSNQKALATLVITLGNAVSGIAAVQGNHEFSERLLRDTNRLTELILDWKPGQPTDHVHQAITAIRGDLDNICNYIKDCGTYKPLILLSLSTLDSILAMVNHQMQTVSNPPGPETSEEFAQKWDNITATNPALHGLEIVDGATQ